MRCDENRENPSMRTPKSLDKIPPKSRNAVRSPSWTRATASQKKPNADPSCLPPTDAFSYCGGGTCTGGGATFTEAGGGGGVNTTAGAATGLSWFRGEGDGEGDGAALCGVGVEKSERWDSGGGVREAPRGVLAGDGGVMKTVRFPARPIMGGGGGDGEDEDPITSAGAGDRTGAGGAALRERGV